MPPRNIKTYGKRKVEAAPDPDSNNSLSPSNSLVPSPPRVLPEAEQPSQPNKKPTTPTNNAANSNRSVSPPTISPLSDPPPKLSLKRARASSSDSPTLHKTQEVAQHQRNDRGRILEEDNSANDSESSLSSLSSNDDANPQPASTAPGLQSAHPDHSKPIVFTPYFKRPDFIPQPKITGNEAWAKNMVWNDEKEKKRYEIVDLEAIAKY